MQRQVAAFCSLVLDPVRVETHPLVVVQVEMQWVYQEGVDPVTGISALRKVLIGTEILNSDIFLENHGN